MGFEFFKLNEVCACFLKKKFASTINIFDAHLEYVAHKNKAPFSSIVDFFIGLLLTQPNFG